MKRLVLATTLSLSLVTGLGVFAQDQGQGAPTESTEARIARLVRELGDSSFDKRSAAQKELEQIGRPAVGALEKAAQSEDPEVATRAAEALARIRGQVPTEERPRPEQEEPTPVPPPMQPLPMPDMDELWQELERSMPEDMGELFRRLFRGPGGGGGGGAEPQPDEDPNAPRFRFQMRRLGPNGEWEVIEENGAGVPGLGMTVGPANAALRAQLSIDGNEGVVVNQVLPGGLAEKAGIKLYDVIVAVDGRAVRSARDLKPLLAGASKVELYRRAQKQTIEVQAPAPGGSQPPRARPDQPQPPRQGRSF